MMANLAVRGAEAGWDDPAAMPGFNDPDLFDALFGLTAVQMDDVAFGVIAMAADGTVEIYNTFEARMTGLTPGRVIGRNFFLNVAPCCNNFMVAHRYEAEAELDAVIDYVFTFRMKPQKVRLRLLKRDGVARRFLVVERKA